MTITLTTPEFTRHELGTMRNALVEASSKLHDGGWARQSLIDETDEALVTVISAAIDAKYALEIDPRTKQIIGSAVTAYGIKREFGDIRSTVLGIVTKLEKAEVK